MGTALVSLGVFLLLTQVLEWNAAVIMVAWWPVLFIILGVEILVFLWRARQEQPHVKYDILSIIFIGVIGTAGIGLSILSSAGLLEKAATLIAMERETVNIPHFEQAVGEGIKRVVVETGHNEVRLESTPAREVSIFGTYRGLVSKGKSPFNDVQDYALIEQRGDTMYVIFKQTPSNNLGGGGELEPILLIPEKLDLEVNGEGSELVMKPRDMSGNWNVKNAMYVKVDLDEKSDVKINAKDVYAVEGAQWNISKEFQEGERGNASFTAGKGTTLLNIASSDNVIVHSY